MTLAEIALWNLLVALYVSALVIAGALAHEYGHYILGAVSGGSPSFEEYWFFIPSYVKFEEPKSMADWQVRITGGFPIVLLFVCGAGLLIRDSAFAIFGLGGGAMISTLDMMALYHPGAWKDLATGDSVSLEDLEPPSAIRWIKNKI